MAIALLCITSGIILTLAAAAAIAIHAINEAERAAHEDEKRGMGL